MAITTTPNLELTKDSSDEFYDVMRVNANTDKIDAAVAAKADKSELPNIKKNPSDTTGDIIDTHLTVGKARATGDMGSCSFVSGGAGTDNEAHGNLATARNSAVVGGYDNTVQVSNGAVIGGLANTVKYDDSGSYGAAGVVIGGANNVVSYTNATCIGGQNNVVSGAGGCVGGASNKVTNNWAVCVGGNQNKVNGGSSVCIGGWQNSINTSEPSANNSACIGGDHNNVNGKNSTALGGANLMVGSYQTVTGKFNSAMDGPAEAETATGSLFIVGNGTSDTARSNAFRVTADGVCYGKSSFRTSGADYAEFFEWQDGNPDGEDRRGIFVTLDGEKIRPCVAGEYILGVVSSNPSVCGDSASESWHGMYETNIFGDIIYDNGEPKISPQYDPSKTYVPREKRPEWTAVGMLGKLVVTDDGTCEPNGCCAPSQNGIATAAETGYRVLSRIDDTHIKILMR